MVRKPASYSQTVPRGAAERTAGPDVPGRGGSAPWRCVAAVFVLALAVRGLYLADAADYPAFAAPGNDALSYDQRARALLAGEIPAGLLWQGLFYPVFLAGVYAVSGGSIVFAKIVQAVLGAGTAALACRLGQRWLGRSAGLTAGLITALYGPLVFYETELLSTGWTAVWMLVLPAGVERLARRGGWVAALGLGLAAGLAVLTRAEFLPFLALCAFWLAWRWWRVQPASWRRAAGWAGAGLAGFAAVTIPAGLLGRQATGRFTFLPASGGINFYIGNHPRSCELLADCRGWAWQQLAGLPARAGHQDPRSQQRWFYHQALAYAAEHPLEFARGYARKLGQFASSHEIPRNEDLYVVRNWSVLLSALVWKIGPVGFPFILLAPLALVGAALARRQIPVPVWLLLIGYPLIIAAYFVAARFRAPLVPVLALLAGAGIEPLRAAAARRDWRTGAQAALAAVLAVALGCQTGVLCPPRHDFHAGLYLDVGYYRGLHGDEAGALACYRQAVALRPDYAEAWANVGNTLLDRGELAAAGECLATALRYGPEIAMIQACAGEVLLRQGRLAEAEPHFRAALRLDETLARPHQGLGVLLMQSNRAEEGLALLRRAAELAPGDAQMRFNLGAALGQLGRHAEELEAYAAAVRLSPANADIRLYFGQALERAGRRGPAAEQYRAVLRLQPDHPQARAGLQRVLAAPGTP